MSDLREAFERVADRAARAARTQPASNVIRREIMALADRALSQPEAVEAVADPILAPKNFLDDILSACDASNWDADRNKGDYFRGLNDAYETILEIAIEYQLSIYAWCKRPPLAPDAKRMRRALESWLDAEIEDASNRQHASFHAGNGKLGEKYYGRHTAFLEVKQKVEALSRADEGKESEGGASRPYVPETEEEATELADNGRNTGGKSYYRPSDPTPPDRVPGLNWELSEETKKRLAEIDQAIVRPGDPRLNQIICGPQTNPVQDAEPATSVRLSRGSDQVGRTGGANPPTGSTPPDPKPWPNGCRNPNSCSIHRDCMYLQCKHYERDISGEVDAAIKRGGQ